MSGITKGHRAPTTAPPSIARWVVLCATAEAAGMTAAAGAAVASDALVGGPVATRGTAAAVALVVAGGLIEGAALGGAQAWGLRRWLPGIVLPWVLVTLAVAGLGWAFASVPVMLAGDGAAEPPLLAVLGGAVGIGVAMGALLGAAQALVLRGRVPRPWRWVQANVLAWAGAMPVIFLGTAIAGAGWPVLAVVGLGTVTGLAAGAVLGLVSGWFLPSLAGPSPRDRTRGSLRPG